VSDSEKMVPLSQAARMLTTGFEWEAGLFYEVYRSLSDRLGADEARKMLGKAMYEAGRKLGKEARGMVDRSDPKGMAEAWDLIYGAGTKEAETLDADGFVIRAQGCAAYALFKRWGMSEEEIRSIADSYCAGDVGHAEGFGDDLHFQHTARLMRGDSFCRWVFSTRALERSDGAVSKERWEGKDR
jgi:hypothetical protein